MKASLAQLARRRLAVLPPGPPHPEVQEAKVAFFEAKVNRDLAARKAAKATMNRYARTEPTKTPAERAAASAKFAPRLRLLSKWILALRERREEASLEAPRPKVSKVSRGPLGGAAAHCVDQSRCAQRSTSLKRGSERKPS